MSMMACMAVGGSQRRTGGVRRLRSLALILLSSVWLAACGASLDQKAVDGVPPGGGAAVAGPVANDVIAQARQAILDNRYSDAHDLLDALIEREPSNAAAFSLRGIANIREGRVYPAVRDLKAAADLSPSATAYYNLGNALQQAGFYDRAVTAYRAALELAPDDAEILNNYGASLVHLGRTGEGISALERVIAMRPNDPQPHTNIGIAHAIDKNYRQAEEHYRRALAVDPDYWPAVFNLAKAYVELGRDDQASATYKRYLQLRPNAPDKQVIMNRAGLGPEDL